MRTNSGHTITPPSFSLAKGGGAIRGIGETFQPNPFSGTGSFSIPLATSPCRGFEPELSLAYSSGSGNGIFGLGFSLSPPNIARKTEKAIPQYNDSDTFVLSNADDLVPKLMQRNGTWINAQDEITHNNTTYTVTQYRPRGEGLFAQIEQWRNTADNDIHWRVTTADNVTSIYGRRSDARIADPADKKQRVFQWLLEESWDARGNRIIYEYIAENDANVPASLSEVNRSHTANVYLYKIKYGYPADYTTDTTDTSGQWRFEVIFDYGQHAAEVPSYEPLHTWPQRQDSFSTYKAGFEIRTHRLCQRILMFHHFEQQPVLVSATHIVYDQTPGMSFLTEVRQLGYRKNPDNSY